MKAAVLARLVVLFTVLNFMGCLREPTSDSSGDDACEAMCASVVCLNPDSLPGVVEGCETRCLAKFEESARQGPSCEETFTEAMTCLAALSCSEYADWTNAEVGHRCSSARSDVMAACDGIYLEPEVLPP